MNTNITNEPGAILQAIKQLVEALVKFDTDDGELHELTVGGDENYHDVYHVAARVVIDWNVDLAKRLLHLKTIDENSLLPLSVSQFDSISRVIRMFSVERFSDNRYKTSFKTFVDWRNSLYADDCNTRIREGVIRDDAPAKA